MSDLTFDFGDEQSVEAAFDTVLSLDLPEEKVVIPTFNSFAEYAVTTKGDYSLELQDERLEIYSSGDWISVYDRKTKAVASGRNAVVTEEWAVMYAPYWGVDGEYRIYYHF